MTTSTRNTFVQLPLLTNIALYAPSTQEEEVTTPTHVYELVQCAHAYGYQPSQISIFADSDEGTPVAHHERYQALLTAMRNGSISVVFLPLSTPIFAGVPEEEINHFIHLCMAKGIFVVTPPHVYDFQNLSHVALFRKQYVR